MNYELSISVTLWGKEYTSIHHVVKHLLL